MDHFSFELMDMFTNRVSGCRISVATGTAKTETVVLRCPPGRSFAYKMFRPLLIRSRLEPCGPFSFELIDFGGGAPLGVGGNGLLDMFTNRIF
jgi:hypothetical protein